MKSFQVVTLAAIASLTNAALECSSDAAAVPIEYCGVPLGAQGTIDTLMLTYDKHISTTSDGYKLALLRLTAAGRTTIDAADVGAKGPVMLHHG